MEIDTDKLFQNAIADAIREGIKDKFKSSYNNPFDKLIEASITAHADSFKSLLSEAIGTCMASAEFRQQIREAANHSIAKHIIAKFGGEVEKQVNVLKSDPSTRARITLAIEEIVKSKA